MTIKLQKVKIWYKILNQNIFEGKLHRNNSKLDRVNKLKEWSAKEDKLLIENFEDYEDLPEYE
jgi:hypothetical protein